MLFVNQVLTFGVLTHGIEFQSSENACGARGTSKERTKAIVFCNFTDNVNFSGKLRKHFEISFGQLLNLGF